MADTTAESSTALTGPTNPLLKVFGGLEGLPQRNRLLLLIGIPLFIAIIVSAFLWTKEAQYKTLFSNMSDQDGGAIVNALNQMNIPYRYSEHGGSILIPAEKVHDTRLKLASQGLPKGSVAGFELLENQKLGITQFQEQVNYQRALEGELTRSIQSLQAVQTARVHLAIPKPSIFLRDQQKPSASVVLQLRQGQGLDRKQIQGIIHLVASSVPDLNPAAVSIVDQNGSLLTQNPQGNPLLDATQLAYIQQIEHSYTRRIIDLLVPIYGLDNVRATVTADIDFSEVQKTEEMFKPNGDPQSASIRSQQLNESSTPMPTSPQGVPGTLTNQPPGNSTAPIGGNPQAGVGQNQPPAPPASTPPSTKKDSTTNYELDKSVKVTRSQIGQIQKLSAAVVINHRTVAGPKGEVKTQPLESQEIEQITALVRDAMGYNKDRGDAVNITNQAFSKIEEPIIPLWKDPTIHELAQALGLPLGVALATAVFAFGVLRPLLKRPEQDTTDDGELLPAANDGRISITVDEADAAMLSRLSQQDDPNAEIRAERMERLKLIARENPQLVANIVREWMGKGE